MAVTRHTASMNHDLYFCLYIAFGALGGLLNGLMSDRRQAFPSLALSSRGRSVVQLGLLGNIAVASLFSCVCTWALGMPSGADQMYVGSLLLRLLVTTGLGFGAARLLTGEFDKRLLREAVCNASAAPAAPPATVEAMESATPWVVYTSTAELMPPPAEVWRFGL
jgi:hypothetical protein